ncbi:hypothetical protein, partial [Candidatus Thiodiazotropha endoloripes]|uniref:hypothetical protein n=1 Tax=Candidatus Thiodiazotropha endoloripes TaxID=1818881 RepID=UPI001F3DCED9
SLITDDSQRLPDVSKLGKLWMGVHLNPSKSNLNPGKLWMGVHLHPDGCPSTSIYSLNEDGSVCINVGPHTGIPGPSFGVGLGGLFE